MNDIKWIKIQTDIFTKTGGSFDAIKSLQDAKDIELIWIQLLCLAGTCNENGALVISKEFPYTDEMLAKAFDYDIGVIQRALGVFIKLNMIEVVDNIYLISNWSKYQSADKLEQMREKNRERQRRFYDAHKSQPMLPEKSDKNANIGEIECQNQKPNVRSDVRLTLNGSISNSYSFNTHNNKENYIYIKNKGEYKNLIYINNNKELDSIILEWLDYKDEMSKNKGHYDTERGMCSLLTEFVNNDKSIGTGKVKAVVHHCMAKNWTGIYWNVGDQVKAEPLVDNETTKKEHDNPIKEPDFSDPNWMDKMTDEEYAEFAKRKRGW